MPARRPPHEGRPRVEEGRGRAPEGRALGGPPRPLTRGPQEAQGNAGRPRQHATKEAGRSGWGPACPQHAREGWCEAEDHLETLRDAVHRARESEREAALALARTTRIQHQAQAAVGRIVSDARRAAAELTAEAAEAAMAEGARLRLKVIDELASAGAAQGGDREGWT